MGDSKISVDNMLELAMGLSMASLFTQAMSKTFDNIPRNLIDQNAGGAGAPPKYIYAMIEGRQQGPLSLGEVTELIRGGQITLETYVWKPGMSDWKHAKDITDIGPTFELAPPQAPNI